MTVEENILKKANQKRLLVDVSIEGGNFTTAFFKTVSSAPSSCPRRRNTILTFDSQACSALDYHCEAANLP